MYLMRSTEPPLMRAATSAPLQRLRYQEVMMRSVC